MSNMNDEKEKHFEEIADDGDFYSQRDHRMIAEHYHSEGFDAGVLAERERVSKIIIEKCFSLELLGTLFPQQE